jgi:hypothetical protein
VTKDEDEVSAMWEGRGQGKIRKGLGGSPNPNQERSPMRTILRALFSRGKFTVLAVAAALTLGTASAALGANGGNFILGVATNSATAITQLTANIASPALKIVNTSTSTGATALNLQTATSKPPMTVNSGTKVTNLNADRLDSKDSTQFLSAVPYENSNLVAVPAGANNQSIFVKCDPGDVAVSGGADNLEPPTELNEVSRLIGTSDTWEVEVSRPLTQGGDPLAEDPQGVLAEVYCWDKASPFRPGP